MLRAALLQTDIAWEDPEASFARLRPRIARAAAAGARLVVLPEMFACGFSMDTARVAEGRNGPSTAFLRDEAARHGIYLLASLPERPAPAAKPSNTLVVAGPTGDVLARYPKIHPFTYAREHDHYAAGDAPVTVELEGVRLALTICYDLRFADLYWDLADRVDAYVCIANWPEKRRQHWRTLLRARAIENQAYVLGVNRVGEGGGLAYAGDSAAIDPWGDVLCEAARDEALLLCELDPERVRRCREGFPVLSDRRPR